MALTTQDKLKLDNHPGTVNASGLRIYVAGPYSAQSTEQKWTNVWTARQAGAELYRRGHMPFIPHTMTEDFDVIYPDIPRAIYLDTDLVWLHLCDAILMLPNWSSSEGSREELTYAQTHGKIIFWDIEDVPNLINSRWEDNNGQRPEVVSLEELF